MRSLPDLLESLANWLCVAVIAGVAVTYSLSLASTLLDGQVTSFDKGTHRLISFANQPYAFISNLGAHLMMNGTIWYAAYWIWLTNIRKQGR